MTGCCEKAGTGNNKPAAKTITLSFIGKPSAFAPAGLAFRGFDSLAEPEGGGLCFQSCRNRRWDRGEAFVLAPTKLDVETGISVTSSLLVRSPRTRISWTTSCASG